MEKDTRHAYMHLFIIILTYKKPLSDVEFFLAEHKKYLNKYYASKTFIVSGQQNPRIGGVILCKANDKAGIQSIIEEDPFFIHDIAKYEIIEFEATKYLDEFNQLL